MSDDELKFIISAEDKTQDATKSATKGIKDLEDTANKAADGMGGLQAGAVALGVTLGNLASQGIGMAVGQLKNFAMAGIDTARKMEVLGVSLKTAFQGNEKAAKDAQDQMVKFAAKTPYQIAEVAESFLKLKNMGLDPGQKALTAYGNTASSMGKTLGEMTDAVAQASVGNFRSLRSFGIIAQKTGKDVEFTFQGVTTKVKDNSKDIQKYLIDLGNTKFAGGMEAQSQTLDGIISTLTDNFNMFAGDLVKDLGIFDFLKDKVKIVKDYLGSLDAQVVASQITTFLSHLQEILLGVGDAFQDLTQNASVFNDNFIWLVEQFGVGEKEAIAFASGLQNIIDQAVGLYNTIKPFFEFLGEKAVNIWNNLVDAFTTLTEGLPELAPEVEDLFNAIKPLAEQFFTIAGIIGGALIMGLAQVAEWMSKGVKPSIEAAIPVIRDIIVAITFWVNAFQYLQKVSKQVYDSITGVFSGMAKVVGAAITSVIKNINTGIDKINDMIQSARKVPLIGQAVPDIHIPTIPGFAKGGDFIVPAGFNRDNFIMGVQSGERVQVTPANQVNNTNNNKDLSIGAINIYNNMDFQQLMDQLNAF